MFGGKGGFGGGGGGGIVTTRTMGFGGDGGFGAGAGAGRNPTPVIGMGGFAGGDSNASFINGAGAGGALGGAVFVEAGASLELRGKYRLFLIIWQ